MPRLDSKLPLRLFILQFLPSKLCCFLEALCYSGIYVYETFWIGYCELSPIVVILEISLYVWFVTIEACVSTAIFKRGPCLTYDFTRIWSIIVKRLLQRPKTYPTPTLKSISSHFLIPFSPLSYFSTIIRTFINTPDSYNGYMTLNVRTLLSISTQLAF